MSRLDKYKRPSFGPLEFQHNIKLPHELDTFVKEQCEKLHMTPPEYFRILVYEEAQSEKNKSRYPKISDEIQNHQEESAATTEYPEVPSKPPITQEPQITIRPRPSVPKMVRPGGNGQRFNTKQYKVSTIEGKEMLPCPLCEAFVSTSNFSRHAKLHDTTTQDIYENPDYLNIIKKMISDWKDSEATFGAEIKGLKE